MPYSTGTVAATATAAAKDLMDALHPRLIAAGLQFVESWQSPSLAAAPWKGLAYGNGVWVSICNGTGAAATSGDGGVTWTLRSHGFVGTWNAIAFGNGVFVVTAVNSQATLTSTDGINWTRTATAMPVSTAWNNVVFGNGVFVAVGTGTNGATSTDGVTWTPRTLPSGPSWNRPSYLYGSTFVIASQSNASLALSSDNGATWTNPAAGASGINQYAWGAGVAVGLGNGTSTAYTATTLPGAWTSRAMPVPAGTPFYDLGLQFANGVFLGMGLNVNPPTAATSPDGTTWTLQRPPATASGSWTGFGYAAGRWLAVSGYDSAYSTDNGVTWTLGGRLPGAGATVPTAYVYKSPAAGNTANRDWYLILRRDFDAAGTVGYQVAENYNAGTHLMSGYGGTATAVLPGAGGINPQAAAAPDNPNAFAPGAFLSTSTSAFGWYLSATPDRVVAATAVTTSRAAYLGLYEDVLPSGTTVMPLVAASLGGAVTTGNAIGGNSANAYGGFTREPNSAQCLATNFEAVAHNGVFPVSTGLTVPHALTPTTTTAALYTNTGWMSRLPVGSPRPGTTPGDSVRGLLYGVWQYNSTAAQAQGDTVTPASTGKQYVRFCGPNTVVGQFVDTSV